MSITNTFCSGDEFDDEEMLDWLTDPNVMEVNDQIEQVNRKMFDKMTSLNENVAVLFGNFFMTSFFALAVIHKLCIALDEGMIRIEKLNDNIDNFIKKKIEEERV